MIISPTAMLTPLFKILSAVCRMCSRVKKCLEDKFVTVFKVLLETWTITPLFSLFTIIIIHAFTYIYIFHVKVNLCYGLFKTLVSIQVGRTVILLHR